VTEDGTPKLLDFGIAKILGPESADSTAVRTLTLVRLLTPEYASPEQLCGDVISTASDVYSLGVVLYELLTGHRPYDLPSRNPDEIARAVGETEPEKPSAAIARVEEISGSTRKPVKVTPEIVSDRREGSVEKLRRRLSGDLDNIVLMALRKEPQRRYASVEQFSADIGRHLDGLPVAARRATFRYRSSKFARRHATGVAAAALVALSLIGGLAVSMREAHIARVQQTRAERRFNDVRRLANSLMFGIHDVIRDLPGSTSARKTLVDRALEYLDSLAQESRGDPTLQRELAAAYEKLGLVQGDTSAGSRGDTAGALKSNHKKLALRQALASSSTASPQDRLGLATALARMGRLALQMGDISTALDLTRNSVEITEALRGADPSNHGVLIQLQSSYDALADTLSSETAGSGGLGRLQEAAAVHSKEVRLGQDVTKLYPADVDSWRSLGIAFRKVGNDQLKTGQRKEALASFIQAKDVFAKLAADHPTSARLRRSVAACYSSIGDVQAWDGNLAGALGTYRILLSMNRAAAMADPQNEQAQIDLVLALDGVGYAQSRLRQFHEAGANLDRVRELAEKTSHADPTNA